MPFKKSAKPLLQLCVQIIGSNFLQLKEELPRLPLICIEELNRRKWEFLNICDLVPEIFIRSTTRKLDDLFMFCIPYDTLINEISNVCKNLTILNLKCLHISSDVLINLFPNIPKIENLNLTSTLCENTVLSVIGSHCSNLKYLDISRCTKITDNGIYFLCCLDNNTSRNLKISFLNISNTSTTSNAYIIALKNLQVLKQLNIHKSGRALDVLSAKYKKGDTSVYSLAVLSVEGVLISEENLKNTFIICPKVQDVSITGYITIIPDRFNHYFKNFFVPTLQNSNLNLKRLSLRDIGPIDVKLIGYLCPNLKILELRSHENSYSENYYGKCKHVPLKRLRKLKLEMNFHSSEYLLELLVSCKNLEFLSIVMCHILDDNVITNLLELNKFPNLKSVNLSNCHAISEDSIIGLLELENPLQTLSISDCMSIRNDNKLKKYVLKNNLETNIIHY